MSSAAERLHKRHRKEARPDGPASQWRVLDRYDRTVPLGCTFCAQLPKTVMLIDELEFFFQSMLVGYRRSFGSFFIEQCCFSGLGLRTLHPDLVESQQ